MRGSLTVAVGMAAVLMLGAGCAPHPRYIEEPRVQSYTEPKAGRFRVGQTWTGRASFYGPKFHGRMTASGEQFDMHALNAAHRSLPFGTILEVTNLSNGRSCQVKVNDRGPFKGKRTLDLSLGAAERLDMVQDGVVEVRVRIISLGGQ